MSKITSTTILTDSKSGFITVKLPEKPPFQLLIIDDSVKDSAPLIDALEPEIPVAFLNSNKDGIQQLTDILSKYKNLKALHIVAHGSSGTLNLGNTSLNRNNIDDYAPQLHSWRKALSENADLFLYSCEIAADGGAFLSRLHQYLGVNVAGSREKVGNPKLGGTWNLDVMLGKIRSRFPFNRVKLAAYPGVLATYTVTKVAELTKAIADANATLVDDTIELAAGTYNLTAVDNDTSDGFASMANGLPTPAALTVGGKLTINGNGAIIQRDSAAPAFRFFYVPSNTDLTLNNLTFSNGLADKRGGAIYVTSTLGNLTVNNSTFTNNKVTGDGGYGGGAICIYYNSTATINNSTFSGNIADDSGGAIHNIGTLNVTNSTFTKNIADNNVTNNTTYDAGGAIFQNNGKATLNNTLIAGNLDLSTNIKNPDLAGGTWTDGGGNLIGNNTGAETAFPASPANPLVGTAATPLDAKLGPLANNGALIQTHALLAGSPAIDAGKNANATALTTDQRGTGFARIVNTTVDIGAFEYTPAGEISSVNVPPALTFKAGDNLDFIVNFTQAVTINQGTGSVYIPVTLNTGGTVNATLVGTGAASKFQIFRYNIALGNADNDGIVLGASLTLTGNATVQDGGGNSVGLTLKNVGDSTGVNVDAVPPTVSSITRQTPTTATTNANSVVYQVNFSEAVKNLDVSDFTLTPTGTAKGTIASVSATTGNSVTVTVNNITGDGDLRLDTIATPTIQDLVGNSLTTVFTTGETYTLDKTPPTITKISRQNPTTATTNANSVVYQVDFSEGVQGLDVSDFALTPTGTAKGAIASVSAATGNSVTVTVNNITGEGDLRLDTIATPTIQDLVGNSLTTAFTTGETYTFQAATTTTATTTTPTTTATTTTPTTTATTTTPTTTATTTTPTTTATTTTPTTTATTTTPTTTATTTTPTTTATTTTPTTTATTTTPTTTATTTTPTRVVEIPIFNGDQERPKVEVQRARNQSVQTSQQPINFTVTFSEAVTGFGAEDIILTTGDTILDPNDFKAEVTGSGTTYNVAISGIKTLGTTVQVKIKENAAKDGANNESVASSSQIGPTAGDFVYLVKAIDTPSSSPTQQGTTSNTPSNQTQSPSQSTVTATIKDASGNPTEASVTLSNSQNIPTKVYDGVSGEAPIFDGTPSGMDNYQIVGSDQSDQKIDFPSYTVALPSNLGGAMSYQEKVNPSKIDKFSNSGINSQSSVELLVVTPFSNQEAPDQGPLTITGARDNPDPKLCLINTSYLPTDSNLNVNLNGIDEAFLEGQMKVTCGAEPNIIVGDENSQTMELGKGSDQGFGGAGEDIIYAGKGSDYVEGNGDNDSVFGDLGDDTLLGGKGNDYLNGGDGKDSLFGDLGNDTLNGGLGDDILTGGAGNDLFILTPKQGSDTVTDFQVGQDLFGLKNNLTFADLTITDGTDKENQGGNTLIRITATNELLASLKGISATSITASSFVVITPEMRL